VTSNEGILHLCATSFLHRRPTASAYPPLSIMRPPVGRLKPLYCSPRVHRSIFRFHPSSESAPLCPPITLVPSGSMMQRLGHH
jgi:hypothetical protein